LTWLVEELVTPGAGSTVSARTVALGGGELGGVGMLVREAWEGRVALDSCEEECKEELLVAFTELAYNCCAKESPVGCD
jgi:hypothetical protein